MHIREDDISPHADFGPLQSALVVVAAGVDVEIVPLRAQYPYALVWARFSPLELFVCEYSRSTWLSRATRKNAWYGLVGTSLPSTGAFSSGHGRVALIYPARHSSIDPNIKLAVLVTRHQQRRPARKKRSLLVRNRGSEF